MKFLRITAETNEVCRLETIITFVDPTIEKLYFDENDSKTLLWQYDNSCDCNKNIMKLKGNKEKI